MTTTNEHWYWRDAPKAPGRAVIFDIDGVLSDASGRQHHIESGDWKAFFEACGEDPVIAESQRLLDLLDADLVVILVTGRPRRVQSHTVEWLTRHGLRWDLLVTRDHGDYSGVDAFKRGVLHELGECGYDIRLALEDDPKNHAMYVAEGIPCVYIHSGYYL
jgi:beta-phosphoglucomutase-like phosphatase (HAD superfamily)